VIIAESCCFLPFAVDNISKERIIISTQRGFNMKKLRTTRQKDEAILAWFLVSLSIVIIIGVSV